LPDLKGKDVALNLKVGNEIVGGESRSLVVDATTMILELDTGEGGLTVAMHHGKLVNN
jgi:hypothetical protein